MVGDVMRLPYQAGRLDFFLCVAVIHHLSTNGRRLEAIQELARLLRPGGTGLIQVSLLFFSDENFVQLIVSYIWCYDLKAVCLTHSNCV